LCRSVQSCQQLSHTVTLPLVYPPMEMNAQKKSTRSWLYLNDEDEARLDKLVAAVGTLNEATVLSAIASAGLRACEEIGNRLPLPLKFQIVEGVPEAAKPLMKGRR
jgi:hypothetical protein